MSISKQINQFYLIAILLLLFHASCSAESIRSLNATLLFGNVDEYSFIKKDYQSLPFNCKPADAVYFDYSERFQSYLVMCQNEKQLKVKTYIYGR